MITHDVIEAVLLADRIAVIHEGRIAAYGTPHDLMDDSDKVRTSARSWTCRAVRPNG